MIKADLSKRFYLGEMRFKEVSTPNRIAAWDFLRKTSTSRGCIILYIHTFLVHAENNCFVEINK